MPRGVYLRQEGKYPYGPRKTEAEKKATLDAASRAWKERNRSRVRANSLRWYYAHKDQANRRASTRRTGWTQEQYEAARTEQDGKCAICGAKPLNKQLGGDHDHITGARRGLLCDRCNVGLGHFDDNTNLLKAAASYLERFKE